MNDADDLQALAARWQSLQLPEADVDWLQENVQRKKRRLLWANVIDALSCLAFIVLPLWHVWPSPSPLEWTWLIIVWSSVVIIMALLLWNRRDSWQHPSASVQAHLHWSMQRCRRQRRTIAISWIFFGVQCLLVVTLRYLFIELRHDGNGWLVVAVLALFAFGLGIWSALYRQAINRDLKRLQQFAENYSD